MNNHIKIVTSFFILAKKITTHLTLQKKTVRLFLAIYWLIQSVILKH